MQRIVDTCADHMRRVYLILQYHYQLYNRPLAAGHARIEVATHRKVAKLKPLTGHQTITKLCITARCVE